MPPGSAGARRRARRGRRFANFRDTTPSLNLKQPTLLELLCKFSRGVTLFKFENVHLWRRYANFRGDAEFEKLIIKQRWLSVDLLLRSEPQTLFV
ncbi:hypothetical protein M514_08103 [Trichuris suis]|uniref:Uncharacterized protein n=1 Tax=Trichuris suis TaxID=68888 RepID=A0A085M1G6_9BILA|nr:hypothetical protein M513_08103 [Trichuris suis]KFD73276.1 hypothetical protein M514_08103 [Trichuris suis]